MGETPQAKQRPRRRRLVFDHHLAFLTQGQLGQQHLVRGGLCCGRVGLERFKLVQQAQGGRVLPQREAPDRQLADRSRTILALAVPAIIVVLGGLVGLIILAVLLPILELNTLAGAGIGAS